jgi:hypothetical protein
MLKTHHLYLSHGFETPYERLKGRPTIEIATISHHYQRLCKRCRRLVSLSSHALDLGAVATTARLHMNARQTAGAVRVG